MYYYGGYSGYGCGCGQQYGGGYGSGYGTLEKMHNSQTFYTIATCGNRASML